ncbi:MAG: signal recognition particle-docking protein FtsY [Candidatus Cloacimonadota bacterium]|nr:MAG: signal recognition particle-docking protein FtsY [Candidatus Cloacimonadota bacterium]
MFSSWGKKKNKKLDLLAEEIAKESGEILILDKKEESSESSNSWSSRLSSGLSRTRNSWVSSISSIFGDGKLDEDKLEEFEDILIQGDLGVDVTMDLVNHLREGWKDGKYKTVSDIQSSLKEKIQEELTLKISPLNLNEKPFAVILMVGINGVGKTTTTAKITSLFQKLDKKCMLVACDTFRAGAVKQLETWGERLNVTVVKGKDNEDPASVAFEGIKRAKEEKIDILIIDTAGRLHTQVNLMEEVKKISRVVEKALPGAPHETLMVIDSTTGQNAIEQAKVFNEALNLSGLVVTKLDGTAKGGVVVAIHRQLQIPVRFIGVGEQVNDLQTFNPEEFTEALFAI